MDILGFIFSIVYFVLWLIWSVIWWILGFLFFPLLILAVLGFFVLRFAYRSPFLRPYIDSWLAKLKNRGWNWIQKLAYTITVMPVEVLLHLIWLTPYHALISLLWNPKWKPLERAVHVSRKRRDRKSFNRK